MLLGLLILVWTSCKKIRIDDYWNVDSGKHLSDSWRGFTKFTLLKELSEGYVWSGEETDKDSHNYQTRENTQKFSKNARRKLERPMAPAMPCWRHPSIVKTSAKPKVGNETKNNVWLCCGISWIHEATSGIFVVYKTMRITLLEKDLLLWHVTIGCTSLFRCHKRKEFRMQKLPWTRHGRSSRQFQPGNWRKPKVKRRLFGRDKEKKQRVFATLMFICHLTNAELEPQFSEV